MSTSKTVSFASPATLIAPDLAVQQQQLERKQALIDALRQQSMQQIDGGRGTISWTQGLAKLADALAARHMQKSNDKQSIAMSRGYADRMAGMFGLNRGAPQPAQPQQAQPMPAQPAAVPQPLTPVNPDAALNAPQQQPQQAPQPAPQLQAQEQGGSYPMSLSGNPQQDYFDYVNNPDAFTEAMVKSHAPNDYNRALSQAGIDPNSPLGRQLQQANIAKQNYVAPVNGRPGSTIRDPYDPSKVIGYDAPTIEGAFPVYGPDGKPTGYSQAPGASGAIAQASAAKSGGTAAGQAPYDLVQVYGPDGQAFYVPKSAVLQSGGVGSPGAPPGAVGRAAPPPGTTSAYNVTGTNSANGFQSISDMGADVPNRILALRSMQQLVNDPKAIFGQGSVGLNKVSGYLGTLTGGEAPNVTNANEFNKWAAQYSARSAQELGLSGSDSRVQLAVHATPNGEMTRGALQNIIPQMIGLENAKAGMATASVQWQQVHGPQSLQEFRTAWNQNYDPRIYTWMAQGPQAFAANVKHMPAGERNALKSKYLELKRIGALPQ